MKIELLSSTIEPEKIIACAAKLCYSSSQIEDLLKKQTPEAIEKFLNRVPDAHQSILEHASFTFAVEGVSRITEIQLVRHRIASYSIQSGRYVNRKNVTFIEPNAIKNCTPAHKIFERMSEQSQEAYNKIFIELMIDQMNLNTENLAYESKCDIVNDLFQKDKKTYKKYEKIAIENARYVHMQSLATRIIVTMNVRSLKNFFAHRCCMRSQWEIRNMANQMLKICKNKYPLLFKNAGPNCNVLGYCPEGDMQCSSMKYKIPTNLDIKNNIYNK